MNDLPGRRKKLSGLCKSYPWFPYATESEHEVLPGSGWANTHYFVDPETGIALVFGTQLASVLDMETIKTLMQVEEAFYAALEPNSVPPPPGL